MTESNKSERRRTGKRIWIILAAIIFVAAVAGIMSVPDNEARRRAEADSLLVQGQRAFDDNDVLTAFSRMQQARAEYETLGDDDKFFEATVYLSMIYTQIGLDDHGYELLKNLTFRDVPNYATYSSQYYLRMMGYYSMVMDNDPAKARHYAKSSIEFSKKRYPKDTAFVYMDMANLAETHITEGDYRQAKEMTDRLAGMKPVKNDLYLSQLYYCQGLIAYHEQQYDSAYSFFTKGLRISKLYGAYGNEVNQLGLLIKLDSIAQDMPAYIAHRQQYDSLKTEMSGSKVYYNVAMLKEQHRVNMLEQERRKNKTIYILSAVSMVLLLLVAGAIFALIYKNIKNRQRQQMQEKKDLENAIEMERLEKELMKLKMEQAATRLDKAEKENIAISLRLMGKQNEMDSLNVLGRQMESRDDDFTNLLNERFPNLSSRDMRLIEFIRLGMDSHEIASILNITVESLHKSRYRLRKKLGLEGKQDLETFINSISPT